MRDGAVHTKVTTMPKVIKNTCGTLSVTIPKHLWDLFENKTRAEMKRSGEVIIITPSE